MVCHCFPRPLHNTYQEGKRGGEEGGRSPLDINKVHTHFSVRLLGSYSNPGVAGQEECEQDTHLTDLA